MVHKFRPIKVVKNTLIKTNLHFGYNCIYFILFYILLFNYTCPNFSPVVLLASPTPCSHSQSPPCCLCPWVICICYLTRHFPCFPFLSSYPLPLVTVSLFLVSMPLVLFCSFVCFFHQVLLQVRSYDICLLPPGIFHLP